MKLLVMQIFVQTIEVGFNGNSRNKMHIIYHILRFWSAFSINVSISWILYKASHFKCHILNLKMWFNSHKLQFSKQFTILQLIQQIYRNQIQIESKITRNGLENRLLMLILPKSDMQKSFACSNWLADNMMIDIDTF